MALTSFFAPTATSGPQLTSAVRAHRRYDEVHGADLTNSLVEPVLEAERIGVDFALVAQRWWGSGEEIEGSTFDATAMTAYLAARTERIGLITAIHPGFFLPAPIAKWGATMDRLTGGRWSINVTSGWNLVEFPMYGAELVEHDESTLFTKLAESLPPEDVARTVGKWYAACERIVTEARTAEDRKTAESRRGTVEKNYEAARAKVQQIESRLAELRGG